MSALRELRPRSPGWLPVLGRLPGLTVYSAWQRGPIRVISSLDLAGLPVSEAGTGPQWHISITTRGKRPKPHHVRRALRAFGMVDAEEDNHQPGQARNFWRPVDPQYRVDCECKTTDILHVEPDGFRWTEERGGS